MGTVTHNGFLWPASDRHCHKVTFNSTADMLPALALCRGFDMAVQAGGNCGVWPAWLAERFRDVVTFEPDAENYACLAKNVPGNVEHHNAALGAKSGTVGMVRDPRNTGAHYIGGDEGIRMRTIDSLGLVRCDYICLDVEGYEVPALVGAADTIGEYRPVIQIEDKGLSEKYGYARGHVEAWLKRYGYRVRHRVARDVILSCKSA